MEPPQTAPVAAGVVALRGTICPMDEEFAAVAQPDGSQIATFHLDFVPEPEAEGKAVVSETDDGDLIIEGMAAVFDGVDREGENFAPEAFERGLKAFMETNPVLCYHHNRGMALGQVLEARKIEGKGLWIRARVDRPEPQTIAADIYHKIKKGTIKALSIGGFFKRKLTPEGWKINDCDFTEISVTPVSMHPRTTFGVVAGKAFENLRVPDGITIPTIEGEVREEDLIAVGEAVDVLTRVFDRIERRQRPTQEPGGDIL